MTLHKRGSRQIDYFLFSTELTPYIQYIEYEPFVNGIQSDHRRIYVNINMDIGNVKHVKSKQVESGYDSSIVSEMSRVKVARSYSQPSHLVRNRLREVREAERNQYLVGLLPEPAPVVLMF